LSYPGIEIFKSTIANRKSKIENCDGRQTRREDIRWRRRTSMFVANKRQDF